MFYILCYVRNVDKQAFRSIVVVPSIEYIFDRYAVKGQGHCAAVRFGGSLKNSTMQILGFEIRYDMGGQV